MLDQVCEVHGPFCHTPRFSQPSATLAFSLTHRDGLTFDFRDFCRASVLQPDHAHALYSCSFTRLKFFSMAKVFHALPVPPLLYKMQSPVLLCSCWTHCTYLQLLHRREITAISYTRWSLVLWHSFILRWVLSLASGLVMAKWCCPSPQYAICISKVHLNKEVQETFY